MNQLSKNTVKGTKQLEPTKYVVFDYAETSPEMNSEQKKIMFVGNSITLHGIAPQIGWNGYYGMAASCEENDYVHLCKKDIRSSNPNTSFCICQVCEWESNYKDGESQYHLYEIARNFEADIIVMRAIENCPPKDFDKDIFKKEYDKLIKFLGNDGNAKIVLTTSFWHHPGDAMIREYAKENSIPLVELGDLGEDDSMKAVGKFEHEGVANHPGDAGMKAIAERILGEVMDLI